MPRIIPRPGDLLVKANDEALTPLPAFFDRPGQVTTTDRLPIYMQSHSPNRIYISDKALMELSDALLAFLDYLRGLGVTVMPACAFVGVQEKRPSLLSRGLGRAFELILGKAS